MTESGVIKLSGHINCRNQYIIEMIYDGIADCRLNWKIRAFRFLPLFRKRCINIFNSNFNLSLVKKSIDFISYQFSIYFITLFEIRKVLFLLR